MHKAVEPLWEAFSGTTKTIIAPDDVQNKLWSTPDQLNSTHEQQDDTDQVTKAAKLYAAHRVLNESYDYFVRSGGQYYTRSSADKERVDREKHLFDLKSKTHLLFLLRLDKRRRERREQRMQARAGNSVYTGGHKEPSSTSDTPAQPLPEEDASQDTHVSKLPPDFYLDVRTVRPLLAPLELAEAEWWDPHVRDLERIQYLKQYALTDGTLCLSG